MSRPPIDDRSPPFDEAVHKFRGFLQSHGWPAEVTWLTSRDIRHRGRNLIVRRPNLLQCERRARKVYADAVDRDGGVWFSAICHDRERTFARAIRPRTTDAAERMMVGDTLKLSLAADPLECSVLPAWAFWFVTFGCPRWCRDGDDVIEQGDIER